MTSVSFTTEKSLPNDQQSKVIKVIAYVRISTEKQQSNTSIDDQIKRIQKYCDENGFLLVAIYVEEASAKSIEGRPEFIKMYNQFIDDDEINFLVVFKIDRAFRNFLDSIFFWKKLGEESKHFISIADNINTTNPDSKTSYYINAYMAEKDRDNILFRTSNGMKAKAEKGFFNGGIVFGYESVSKNLRIVPSEAEVIELIFNKYAHDNWGYKKIASELNIQGIKTKKGNDWSINGIKTILQNRIYIGEIKWDNEYRKGIHQPIISDELWNKAQSLMKRKSYSSEKIHPGAYPLSGLIKCPQCGSPMVQGNSSQKYKYYQCNKNKNSGKSVCSSNLVPKDYAEKYVFKHILTFFNKCDLATILYQITISNLNSVLISLEEETKLLTKSLNSFDKKISELYKLVDNEKMSMDTFALLTNDIEQDKFKTNKRITEIEKRIATKDNMNLFENIEFAVTNFEIFYDIISDSEKKRLFHSLIQEVRVTLGSSTKDRKIKEIIYKFDCDDVNEALSA